MGDLNVERRFVLVLLIVSFGCVLSLSLSGVCADCCGWIDHEELWQPAWGVRTAIVALQGFFPLKGQAAIGVGAVEYPESERRRLAVLSVCIDVMRY
jgi:hypothetical protein